MTRFLRYSSIGLLSVGALLALIYTMTWHPRAREAIAVSCKSPAPVLTPGQPLKVMTWNIQYLAGKRYVFWYDMADGSGPDEGPTPEDTAYNLDEVARVVRDEQPDIVLLQEVNDGAKNTDYDDQPGLLRERVADLYPCSSDAFYWKADFIPNPHIYGSVGMKLATLSRYQIDHAERLQLPHSNSNVISRQYRPKRALLVSYLPMNDGRQLAVVNTHLDAYDPNDDGSQRQLQATAKLLDTFESQGTPWLIGGDFNLLPLGQYQRLAPEQRGGFEQDSGLHELWEKYPMIPNNTESSGEDRQQWLTNFPNDPRLSGPDRTVDYFFYSPALTRVDAYVRGEDTLLISNHLPVIAQFLLPTKP